MAERLSDQEIDAGIGRLASGWRREGEALIHEERLADFAAALARLNAIAALAEEAGHHPDLELHGWNGLRVRLSTHSAGGITSLDLALAAAIDDL